MNFAKVEMGNGRLWNCWQIKRNILIITRKKKDTGDVGPNGWLWIGPIILEEIYSLQTIPRIAQNPFIRLWFPIKYNSSNSTHYNPN